MNHAPRIAIAIASTAFALLAGCGKSGSDAASSTPSATTAPAVSAASEAQESVGAGAEAAVDASAALIARGKQAWQAGMCSLCHGATGQGGPLGPNLTSGDWKHADGTVASIVQVLRSGVPLEKMANPMFKTPMEPATKVLPESELEPLAAFVQSLASGS